MSLNKYGKVCLVGAGCGDYDLITLRGKELLEQCDVVVYDSLIDNRLLDFVSKGAERICVGKRCGRHSKSQSSINSILVEKAKEGKNVVRLKGGDPFVFGRGGEEIIELKNNDIEYCVVPGITSAVAVPELAGIPVTHREVSRSFHVITGHTADNLLPENMSSYAKLNGTLVFLMGLNHLGKIADGLINNGMNESTPAAVISNGASVTQRIVKSTLKNIVADVEKEKLETPAIIVVGEVVSYDFLQTVSKPLGNISVSVTGTRRFVNKLSSQLCKLGAEIKIIDYLNVVEYTDNHKLDDALADLKKYRWIVLTSINGAEIFLKRLRKLRIDIRKLSDIKFAVIGSGTSGVLERNGIFAELIPEEFTSRALGKLLSKTVGVDERVLILRAEKGSRELSRILDENNIQYDDIKTYDVLCENQSGYEVKTDFITFGSSSGVDSFFENGFTISPDTKIICIGDVTADALKKHNVDNYKIAATSSIDGITEKIIGETEQCRDSDGLEPIKK